jgi:hypothetical protein
VERLRALSPFKSDQANWLQQQEQALLIKSWVTISYFALSNSALLKHLSLITCNE